MWIQKDMGNTFHESEAGNKSSTYALKQQERKNNTQHPFVTRKVFRKEEISMVEVGNCLLSFPITHQNCRNLD
jgi:hypothetical protein